MKQKGWHVIWKPSRKNITFVNEEGKKVRDRNILKTFNINVTKGELLDEFIRNNERRNGILRGDEEERIRSAAEDAELAGYYQQVQDALEGTGTGDSAEGLENIAAGEVVREKDAAYTRLLQQKAEQKERLEQKIESERSSYRYLNSRLRETEEELDRERGKSSWDKFWEKHHLRLPKKKYRSCYYNRKSFVDCFTEKILFPLGCVIFAVVVFAILIHFDLIWYIS